jgi:RNA polymerase sigma-70 factor (ECF subfamily)
VWNVSDEALLAGFATGDPEAGLVFVRRFQGKVYGLALLMTRNPVDAEEVAQDAFVRAWRYASSFDARRGAVASWLLGITRNVAFDRIRSTHRRPEQTYDESLVEVVTALDTLEDEVVDRDDAARVIEIVRDIPSEQRDALLATTLLGLSAREISEQSGTPLGTVKTRIRLALGRVRQAMEAGVP